MFEELENNKKILIKLLENPNNKKLLKFWLLAELAYSSNAIEGNTLTKRETDLVIQEKIKSSCAFSFS